MGIYSLHVKRPGTRDRKKDMKNFNKKKRNGCNQIIKSPEEENCPHRSGSLFFQLANTPSAWVKIGGRPKR